MILCTTVDPASIHAKLRAHKPKALPKFLVGEKCLGVASILSDLNK
jgi:hypothetical protein